MARSLADEIARLPIEEQEAWLASLPPERVIEISKRPWWFIGRPEQQTPEGLWRIWLILTGRGWGKSRTASEWLVREILSTPLTPDMKPTEWAIIGETFGDARTICVEGPAGVLNVLKSYGLVEDRDFIYNKSSWQIILGSGQIIHLLGADDADAGRGLNLSGLWADEIAKWKYSYDTWNEGLAFALRIGDNPRAIVTTTPKPIKIIKEFLARNDGSIYITRGTLFDNIKNLSRSMVEELRTRYEGTRIGLQELYGQVLEDIEGALWKRAQIDATRVKEAPPMIRVIVGVDPAVTSTEKSDETGIVTAGLGVDGQYYVLADDSLRSSPTEWAKAAVAAYKKWLADRVVAETNMGGDLVILTIQNIDNTVATKKVTATRGKRLRAEPISALYEQGKVHHVGSFPTLEEQMCEWVPKLSTEKTKEEKEFSPDRLDALVWALHELSEGSKSIIELARISKMCQNCGRPNPKSAVKCAKCGNELGDNDGSA